jgi:excisionase family DNA binding protein
MSVRSQNDLTAAALDELAEAVAALHAAVRKLRTALLADRAERTAVPADREPSGGRPRDYLTTREVAELFRTSESTIRYWRHKGIGPRSMRAGRRVLYDRRDVEAHIRELRGT